MLSLTAVFVFIFVALNLMLSTIVIRPVTRLAAMADQVSLGATDVPDFTIRSRDEIAELAASLAGCGRAWRRRWPCWISN